MNNRQVYHYARAQRIDGSQFLFDFKTGEEARMKLWQEQAISYTEISEREFFNEARNIIHVERCDEIAKAAISRTYH